MTEFMNDWYGGRCLCGDIAFQAREFGDDAAHCHCSMCRKFHGAEYATFVSVARQNFRWNRGESVVAKYEAKNGTVRSFCPRCGSSLFFESSCNADVIEIALGTFDDDVPVVPNAHIFVEFAASWSRPNDALPKFTRGRTSTKID
jgi:hypothetical protein